MNKRKVAEIVKGNAAIDGAGVHLVRVLSRKHAKKFDPFLLLDAFDSENPSDYTAGFPTHPHRGIETVTYLISGKIEHEDSLGNKGVINSGCCQWMTAGSGIMHQEMPKAIDRMLGLQLWVNLPAKDKMAIPKYNDIKVEDVPMILESSATIKILSGNYKGTKGAMTANYVEVTFLDVILSQNKVWEWSLNPETTVFIYIFDGEISTTDHKEPLPHHQAILFSKDAETLSIKAGKEGARLVALAGQPLNEPFSWQGPIVMNNAEEITKAFQELETGQFIKHKPA